MDDAVGIDSPRSLGFCPFHQKKKKKKKKIGMALRVRSENYSSRRKDCVTSQKSVCMRGRLSLTPFAEPSK